MTSRNLIQRVNVVIVVVLLVLAAVPAHAFPSTERPSVGWSFGSLWEAFHSLVAGVWQEEGMLIDPNGTTGTGDEGMTIDPSGVTATGDEGMTIDPHG